MLEPYTFRLLDAVIAAFSSTPLTPVLELALPVVIAPVVALNVPPVLSIEIFFPEIADVFLIIPPED